MEIHCPVVRSLMDGRWITWCFSASHTRDSLAHLLMTHHQWHDGVRTGLRCDNCTADHAAYLQICNVKYFVKVEISFFFLFLHMSLMLKDKCFRFFFWIYRANRFSLLGIKLNSSCHRPLHSFIEAPLWERHKSRLLWRESAWQRLDMGQIARRQLPLLQEEQSNLWDKCPIWRTGNTSKCFYCRLGEWIHILVCLNDQRHV